MPFEFLTDDHLALYGRYHDAPSKEQLSKYFYLSSADLTLINGCRHDHTRLGFAVQLCTLKFLGTFLPDPTDVPPLVIRTLARQLGLRHAGVLSQYLGRRMTPYTHQKRIREYLGYREFAGSEVFQLVRFLYGKQLLGDLRPIQLFDLATAHLVAHDVVLPGATTLARLVVRVRERAATALHRTLTTRLDAEQVQTLEDLLVVRGGQTLTPLERLRRAPTHLTTPGLLAALSRIDELRDLNVGHIDLTGVPASRLNVLARQGVTTWAYSLAKFGRDRRLATLLAFVQHAELRATDDALELFDGLMAGLGVKGERLRKKERLRTLGDLDAAALVLHEVALMVLDGDVAPAELRGAIFARVGEAQVARAALTVRDLARPADDEPAVWLYAAHTVGRFLIKLLTTVAFAGTNGARGLLDAIRFLSKMNGGQRLNWDKAPRGFVPTRWRATVFPNGGFDRRAYLLCVAQQLHGALKRRTVFAPRSLRFSDPRAQLLQGEAWDRVRPQVCRDLGLADDPQVELDALDARLHATYMITAANLTNNAAVRVETHDGVPTPVLTPLAALPESETLRLRQAQVEARLPDIDISELMLEMNAFAGVADEIVRACGQEPSAELATSVAAVLVAQACNIGLKAVSRFDVPALSLGRLSWIEQNYIRTDTLIRANARLVDAQSTLPLAASWGGGEVASADGLRFVVPVKTLNAGYNKKYFGAARGNVLHLHQRPVHGLLRPRCAGHVARLAVHSGWAAGTADEPEADRADVGHGGLQRRGLRAVSPVGLPVLTAPGRYAGNTVLAVEPRGGLR